MPCNAVGEQLAQRAIALYHDLGATRRVVNLQGVAMQFSLKWHAVLSHVMQQPHDFCNWRSTENRRPSCSHLSNILRVLLQALPELCWLIVERMGVETWSRLS